MPNDKVEIFFTILETPSEKLEYLSLIWGRDSKRKILEVFFKMVEESAKITENLEFLDEKIVFFYSIIKTFKLISLTGGINPPIKILEMENEDWYKSTFNAKYHTIINNRSYVLNLIEKAKIKMK